MPPGDKYFLVLQSVEHLDFTDARLTAGSRKARTNFIVHARVVAFFNVYLKHDTAARDRYLNEAYFDSLTNYWVPDVWWFAK